MGHEITTSDKMFSVREMPWHYEDTKDRTTIFADYPGRVEAMRAAGHNFRLVERPVLYSQSDLPDWADGGIGQRVAGWKAIIRDDINTVVGMARTSYQIIQPEVLYDLMEAVLKADEGAVRYETAGSLRGGAVMWTLAQMGDGWKVPGDDSMNLPYICVSTSNDGSSPLRVDATDVRVVCANTYGFMQSRVAGGLGRNYTFRHTARWAERVEAAREALRGIRAQHAEYVEMLYDLGSRKLDAQAIPNFLVAFIPAPPQHLCTDRVMNNIEEARDAVRSILNGQTVPDAHRNTAYGLFLAGTEYLDHVRKTKTGAEGKFNRSVLNHDKAKDGVVRLVRELSHAA